MKKFLTILSVVFLSGTTFSQTNEKDVTLKAETIPAQDSKAKVQTTEKFTTEKAKGNFEFELPATATAESVKKIAGYYTQYFTVSYTEKTKIAKIQMIQNDAGGRHVIVRFLVGNGVKEISMDGKDYTLDEFRDKYLI